MKKLFLMIAAIVMMTGISACNTIEGAGQDIQNSGQAIEDAATGT